MRPRSNRPDRASAELLKSLLASGTEIEEKANLLTGFREAKPDLAHYIDAELLEKIASLQKGLSEAGKYLEKLKAENERLTSPPWHPAVFRLLLEEQQKAAVWHGGRQLVVAVDPDVDCETLALGDEVLLNPELNVLLAKAPQIMPPVGETATFERYASGGRLVLRSREQELVVEQIPVLAAIELQHGDPVRWDKNTWIAYEQVERRNAEHYFMTEVPRVSPTQVGGQQKILHRLLDTLTRTLRTPETAKKYQLDSRQSILMVGPPGCGKTLMARVAAAEISRLSGDGKPCRIAVVKPAEWEDPYVGVTQQNIRNCFDSLRKAAEEAYVLLYLDEIESVGRIRGNSIGVHNDKFLAAFLAELDGFTTRGGVAVIAATNRKELLDPAILERLSDYEFQVNRPDMLSAKEIFSIHLPHSLPFSPNGDLAAVTREELIQRAVSLLYDPNADNELCTAQLRDGKTRTIAARELVSGRLIEQICRAAKQAACTRDERQGEAGLRVSDIELAVAEAIERLSTTLTPRNLRTYITDLPQDVEVVSVAPVRRAARNSYQYLQYLQTS